jgi:hypothetical protein
VARYHAQQVYFKKLKTKLSTMKSFNTIAVILSTISVLFLASCNNCEKGSGDVIRVQRPTDAFTAVKLKGSFNLFIRQDSVRKVEIVADDNIAPLIETEVRGGTLVIEERNNKCTRKVTRRDIYISVPQLTSITLEGSGNIEGENTFKGTSLSVIIDGSGKISMSYEGDDLNSVIDGSGNISLSGSSKGATYVITGSGYLDAGQVNAQNVHATVGGSGYIVVTATSTLSANISGSGNISYYGNPSVTQNITGSGSVTKR